MANKNKVFTKCTDCKTKIFEDNLWFAYATTIGCPYCEIRMGKELNWVHAIGRVLEYRREKIDKTIIFDEKFSKEKK